MDEIIEKYKRIYSWETESALDFYVCHNMSYNDYYYLGITNDKKCRFALEFKNGDRKELILEPESVDKLINTDNFSLKDQTNKLPLYLQKPEGANENYWFKLDEENRCFIFNITIVLMRANFLNSAKA